MNAGAEDNGVPLDRNSLDLVRPAARLEPAH